MVRLRPFLFELLGSGVGLDCLLFTGIPFLLSGFELSGQGLDLRMRVRTNGEYTGLNMASKG